MSKKCKQGFAYSKGALQLAIHVAQNRRAGEQKTHWNKTKKGIHDVKW